MLTKRHNSIRIRGRGPFAICNFMLFCLFDTTVTNILVTLYAAIIDTIDLILRLKNNLEKYKQSVEECSTSLQVKIYKTITLL